MCGGFRMACCKSFADHVLRGPMGPGGVYQCFLRCFWLGDVGDKIAQPDFSSNGLLEASRWFPHGPRPFLGILVLGDFFWRWAIFFFWNFSKSFTQFSYFYTLIVLLCYCVIVLFWIFEIVVDWILLNKGFSTFRPFF